MPTKKAKKPEFPQEVFVYKDQWGDDPEDESLIVAESVEETVGFDDVERVGVYQLVKVITVTGTKTVTVEE